MHKRTSSFSWLAVLALVACVLVDSSECGTISSPPLFRESKNGRLAEVEEPAPLADLDYRLPNDTRPIHYDIYLETNVHTGDRSFTGRVTINLNVETTTNQIVLHKRQTTILTAVLKSTEGNEEFELDFESTPYNTTLEFLTLKPVDGGLMLLPDSNWDLTITYTGSLRTDNAGFYLSTYTDDNNNTRYLATTQFESTDARHAFPCFDEPAKRATFTITIKHDPSYTALANMPKDETNSQSGLTVFETSYSMPTYLVAFIISDFKYTEGRLNELTQRIWSRPGTEGDQEWALVSGMLITERLAEYYKVPFAFPKLDQVAVPDFAAGAMENWGLVTYREAYLLYNPQRSTINTQTNVANIIAHEYTHQWFGNLVAVEWWTYLWMKEGFATLFSYQATDDAYPEWGIYQMFHTSEYQSALNNDAGQSPRPMTHYVQTPNEISRLYDTVSYAKAGSVLHMWQNALTDAVFRNGLNVYLETNKFGSAVESKLFDALEIGAKNENHVVPYSVSNMMSSWTRQGGYPMLTVTRDYNTGSFVIEQQTFFNNESLTSDKLWYVPVNYAVQSKADFRDTEATHIFNTARFEVKDSISNDDWLILNKQSTGYYRINYDEQNWNLIIDGLIDKPHRIHPRNRAQLIHDAYRFSSTNRLKHEILLRLMSYLSNEDQYAPWTTAYSILTTFNRYLSGDEDYKHFQEYVTELITPIYEKLGSNDLPGEQHFQKSTRTVAVNLACMVGVESCLQDTNYKITGFVDNGTPIQPNEQSTTYCNGLKQTEDKYFDSMFNILMSSNDQALRNNIISGLGCSQKESQIMKFISSSIDQTNSLRSQERTTLLLPAYANGEVGLLTSIAFLDVNWEAYGKLPSGTFGGGKPLDTDLKRMAQYVVNTDQENKLNALVQKVKNSDYVTTSLESSVASSIAANKDWLSKNRDPLLGWLKSGATSITASFVSIALALLLVWKQL